MVTVKQVRSWFLDPEGWNIKVKKAAPYNSFTVLYDDSYVLNKPVLWINGDSDGTVYAKVEHNNEDVHLLLRKRWRK